MKIKNRLFYYGTQKEVLEGDFITYKGIFSRKEKPGRVSYIPKFTGEELKKQKKQADHWLIEFNDTTTTGWLYDPESTQPSKRLRFINRKNDDYIGITSDQLEILEQQEMEK